LKRNEDISSRLDKQKEGIVRHDKVLVKQGKQIDSILENISARQTQLGSAQNRLYSALDEITIQRENLISSRSTLRDADIAKVSSQYIQQQILQEASATLMATANQSPAIALQLI
jgi:flagellin